MDAIEMGDTNKPRILMQKKKRQWSGDGQKDSVWVNLERKIQIGKVR